MSKSETRPPLFTYATPHRYEGTMTTQVKTAINARVEAGLLDPVLWAAEIAVAVDAAMEIDNPQPGTKAYARAATRSGLLEALDRLPRPEAQAVGAGDLERVLQAIQGQAA